MAPLYTVGTTASMVSIKYKDSTPNLHRYEPHPGALNFRRMFSGSALSPGTPESEDDPVFRTPSLSSSSSSHKNLHFPIPSIPEGHPLISSSPTPKLGSSLEGPGISTFGPSPSNSNQTSTLSFLTRNHTLSNRQPRKPKTSITKTNSSFVQRIITNDQLAKILMARTSEDTNLFYNCGSNFVWMDAFGHPKEPLSRIIFTRAYPTAHDVNLLTRGSDHLDIIIGFSSGDIIWFDPLCNKYGRINKNGIMNSSSITMIRWLQGSESVFMAAFQDGSIMLFDKEKEDEHFDPTDSDSYHKYSMTPSGPPPLFDKQTFSVTKLPHKSALKCNPVSHWKLSQQSITAFAFSPDCQHVAVVGLDGLLRVINFVYERLYDIYQSYYGGLTCVAWSPDGRYILTGGQDDLVTLWAFREQRIIARCQGHHSWVTGVAFDPWRCDEKVYRFASVGEDARLILWDFSVQALHRPKTRANNTRHRGASVSSVNPAPSIYNSSQDRPVLVHPPLSKTEVALLQPTMVKIVHADPCTGVYFREDVIVTTDKRGRVCLWQRPFSPSSSSSYSS
ncbi:WD40-repeat-containing domain protein [Phycomyces nitens]|nr:WD40-repeat-containing domain protein [Phycomyces nitens]